MFILKFRFIENSVFNSRVTDMVRTVFPNKNTTPIDFRRGIPSILWALQLKTPGMSNDQVLDELSYVMNTSKKILLSHYIRASAANRANSILDLFHGRVLESPQSKRSETRILKAGAIDKEELEELSDEEDTVYFTDEEKGTDDEEKDTDDEDLEMFSEEEYDDDTNTTTLQQRAEPFLEEPSLGNVVSVIDKMKNGIEIHYCLLMTNGNKIWYEEIELFGIWDLVDQFESITTTTTTTTTPPTTITRVRKQRNLLGSFNQEVVPPKEFEKVVAEKEIGNITQFQILYKDGTTNWHSEEDLYPFWGLVSNFREPL